MKKRNKRKFNILRIIICLISLIIIFEISPNYEKKNDTYYVQGKINVIIDNNNVTKELKHELFVNDKNIIYMSINDIKNYFDNTIFYDEENRQIITTYGEKKVKLSIDKNLMKINERSVDILSGALIKDESYYIPLNVMATIYEKDFEYIKENKIVILDSLVKKLVKADVAKACNVKYKATVFSKTVDKLSKADKVISIEKIDNNWTKIRTKNGIIGYIKTSILQNEIYIREDFIFR